ncbi:MAG: Gfo/Idh/MocA family oxidoreductase [bacterium]|nr:Gfo/Idh/MocA family oxidoreductase [bacterium]
MAIKVGFVGAGGRAGSHMKVLQAMDDVEITAICDVAEETANRVAGELGARAYTDHHRMLDEEDLTALYVSVPTFAHTDAEVLAVQKGLHLFVEKPVAPTMEKALEILKAVKKAGVLTSAGYQVRYLGYVQQARNFLQNETVAMTSVSRWGGLPGTPWWRVMAQSGGQLVEQTTHQIDLLRYLVGEVEEVHAYFALRTLTDVPNLDIPDVYTLNMKYASGAIGSLTSTCTFREGGGAGTMSMILKNKRAEVESGGVKVYPDGAADPGSVPKDVGDIDEVFMEAIRTGNGSGILSDYEDAVRSLDVSLAANRSAETGKPEKTYFSQQK